ncbi:unnamed protein product [Prorocentrum cordatum]|uniref:Endonuclease/exonuclease/phosphatase domain-containing protein n=1 Tax=Prorocentrum cordatum TaxID=2364126 RepID=A0ABN9TX10_9DINO|nr:unnamed protein product [Polarella glacialis]
MALLQPRRVRRLLGVRLCTRPPGTATPLVANVTRWSASWRGLLAAGVDVWCAQEARIPSAEAESVVGAARARGKVLQVGPGAGGCATHILDCYGYAGGAPDAERNVLEGLEWLHGLGGAPMLLVGDLNCSIRDSRLEGLLGMAGPRPWWLRARVGLRWDLGLATHAALLVELRVAAPEPALLRRPVAALNGCAVEGRGVEAARATAAAAQAGREAALQGAIGRHDLPAAWQQLIAAMREWLAVWRGLPAAPERPHAAAAWQADRTPTAGGGGEAADAAADAALLKLRRLRGFQRAQRRQGEAARRVAQATLTALRAADAARATWARDLATVIFEGGAVDAALVPDPTVDAGAASAAVGSKPWPLALRGGPAAQLRYFEGPWRELRQRQAQEALDEGWLQELGGPPPFPERTPWTAELVAGLLRRMPKRKKPGLDGGAISELRLLPAGLHGWIALEEVEATGEWPRELAEPEVLLPP